MKRLKARGVHVASSAACRLLECLVAAALACTMIPSSAMAGGGADGSPAGLRYTGTAADGLPGASGLLSAEAVSGGQSHDTVQVVYDAGGGMGYMPACVATPGSAFVVAACSFTRVGYTFKGWNTAPDGSGEPYGAGDRLELTADLTLYATWEAMQLSFTVPAQVSCTVTANGDLTAASDDSLKVENLTDAGIAVVGVKADAAPGFSLTPEPSHEGELDYSFAPAGLPPFTASDAAGGGFVPVSWNIPAQRFLQLGGFQGKIASWASDGLKRRPIGTIEWRLAMREIAVSYDPNGAEGQMDGQRMNAQIEFAAPACPFAGPDGKRFAGWSETPAATGAVHGCGSTLSFEDDVTLYAIWE